MGFWAVRSAVGGCGVVFREADLSAWRFERNRSGVCWLHAISPEQGGRRLAAAVLDRGPVRRGQLQAWGL